MEKNTIFLVFFILIICLPFAYASSTPEWVKNTAGWWATNAISEKEFVSAIEYLINMEIIKIDDYSNGNKSQNVPEWVKNTAGWWATNAISEKEFVSAIEFLVRSGIINVTIEDNCNKVLSGISNDLEEINKLCENFYERNIIEIKPFDTQPIFNKKGFTGSDFPSDKSEKEFRIIVLGGSVIQGSGNATEETTIPFILQKMIEQNTDEQVRVINGAGSAGNSIYQTELIKTQVIKYNPDTIIVLAGWNDLSADYSILKIKELWEETCKVASNNKFDIIIFIQPIAGFGNKDLTLQEKINSLTGKDYNGFQLLQSKSSYDFMFRELASLNDGCHVTDIRDVFDDIEGTVYWDQGHLNDLGNLIIADRFHKELDKVYDSKFYYDSKLYRIFSEYNTPSINELIFSELGINVNFDKMKIEDVNKNDNEKGSYFKLKNEIGVENMLVGKDLRKVDLRDIDLQGQDLTGANLSGQDLRDIDLTSTIIRNADLSYTNLEDKDFSNMDLRGVDFSNANMRGVNLIDATISKTIQTTGDCADKDPIINVIKNFRCTENVINNETIRTYFSDADLTNAKFGSTEQSEQMIYFADFSNANLTNSNLFNVQFFGCDFNNSVLNEITGKRIFLLKSDFSDVQMNDFNISMSWLQSISFHSGYMMNGVFDNVTFIENDFTNADLNETNFSELLEFSDNNYNCKNNAICKR